eukprot:GEMP01061652.1.p1 GENE.GEMP01061652.1~~GEMP01061652.1.p1  ORF type:complete len:134 (+),score=16.24 GEMP01061652.1:459-860(+)
MTSCRFVVWVLLPCCTRSLSVAEKNDANEQRYLSVERDFSQLATKIRDGSVVMSTRFHQMLAAATRLTPLTVLSLLVCWSEEAAVYWGGFAGPENKQANDVRHWERSGVAAHAYAANEGSSMIFSSKEQCSDS